jgi:hypothetical protein
MTEAVYVASPGWGHMLSTSLHTLVNSGTRFDSVRIYCVGERPSSWRFTDDRIQVVEVPPLHSTDFLINKTYAVQSKADRVIFLDADTLVLRPLDQIWKNRDTDVIGRIETEFNRRWKHETWHRVLAEVGASPETPYFNTGFFILQNGSQRRIAERWEAYARGGITGTLFNPLALGHIDVRFAEQVAFSMALGASDLSYDVLSPTDHSYGWAFEPHRETTVYHTGAPGFFNYAALLERPHRLRFSSPVVVSRTSRLFLSAQYHLTVGRLKMALKRILNGWLVHRRQLPE